MVSVVAVVERPPPDVEAHGCWEPRFYESYGRVAT